MSAVEVYRRTRKVPDVAWNAYVCRPIAALVVDALKSTRVTPNQITLASLVVALAADGVLLSVPGYWGGVCAILIYEGSYVLDCADGMLARWRGVASPGGHLLDFLMDEIKAFALLATVAVCLARDHAEPRFLWLGLFGVVALASGVALTTFLRRPEITGLAAAATKPESAPRGAPLSWLIGAAKFLVHYPSYIWVCALAGRLELYLLPYVAINALYAAGALGMVALRFGRFTR